MKRPNPKAPPPPRYIDRPEIDEVFADRLEHLFFDGGQVRMEFTVTRTEPDASGQSGPLSEPKRWAYTACRIVLSARGAAEMLNKMNELRVVLAQQGVIQMMELPQPGSEPAQAQSAESAAAAPDKATESKH